MGIPFLFPCAHHLGSSIAVGASVGGVFKLAFPQPRLDSFSGEDKVCKVSRHISYQLLVVERGQRIYHDRDHFPHHLVIQVGVCP